MAERSQGWVEDFIYPEDAPREHREAPLREPQWSGLVDVRGNKLMRAANPVGFRRGK